MLPAASLGAIAAELGIVAAWADQLSWISVGYREAGDMVGTNFVRVLRGEYRQ